MNYLFRAGLFILYSVVVFGLVWFFGAGGHGTFAPVAIFGSWGMVFLKLIPVRPSFLLLASGYFVYYLGMLSLITGLSLRKTRAFIMIPVIIHAIGSLAVFLIRRPVGEYPAVVQWISILVCTPIVLWYLVIDWHFAKKNRSNQEKDE